MNRAAVFSTLLTFWIVVGLTAGKAETGDFPKPTAQCLDSACRTYQLRVKLDAGNGGQYEAAFDPVPYVSSGVVQIFPGETLVFHFASSSDSDPGLPTFVKQESADPISRVPPSDNSFEGDSKTTVQHDPKSGENYYVIRPGSPFVPTETAAQHLKDEPVGTLILSYYQVAGKPDMILRIEHNFPKPLRFDTAIDRLTPNGGTGLRSTSTCPAQPNLADMETWPYPIGMIAIKNFRFVDTSAGFSCN